MTTPVHRIASPAARVSGGPGEVAWLMDSAPHAALLADPRGVIVYANRAFEAMTRFTRAETLGKTLMTLRSERHDPDFYASLEQTLAGGGEYQGVTASRRKDGTVFYEEETIRPLFGPDGRLAWYLVCGRDVSEHIEELARLTRAATSDPLTGLANRALFMDRLELAVEQAHRAAQPLLVVLLDVDRLKAINDGFGHASGDAVLRTVATRLRERVRAVDTVARLGGDEFALLLPDVRRIDAAARTLRGFLRSFVAPVSNGSELHQVSLSIGGVLCESPCGTGETLLHAADEAMYFAKRTGGNAFRLRNAGGASPVLREECVPAAAGAA